MSKRIQILALLLVTAPGLAGAATVEDLKLIHAGSPFGFITYQTTGGGPSGGRTPYPHHARDMHDLGVHWVRATGRRTAFMWGRIQRGPDAAYDWTMADQAIRNLQRERIMALGQLLTVVHWAKEDARASQPNNARPQRRDVHWPEVTRLETALQKGLAPRQAAKSQEDRIRQESPFAANDFGIPSRVARALRVSSKEQLVRVVEAQKIPRFKGLGIKWARIHCNTYGTFGWSGVDPDQDGGELDFSRQDALVKLAQQHGIHLLPVLSPTPTESEWLTASAYVPRDTKAYSAYVRQLVERYDGDGKNDMKGLKYAIKYWQLENEPDLHNKTRTRLGNPNFCTPEQYFDVLKLTYRAVKQADKDAKLLLNVVGFGQNMGNTSATYLERLKELGVEDYYDVFSYHIYPDTFDTALLREMHLKFKRLAGAGKPIWITESGIGSRPKARRLADASERAQAAWVIKHHVFHVASGVKRVVWLSFTDMGKVPENMIAKYAGLLTFRPTKPKLSYYAYKKMVEVLEGSDWETAEAVHQKDGVFIFKFNKGGKPIWVAWNDNKEPKSVRIPLDRLVKDVNVTEALPKYESGTQVADYKTAFNVVRGRVLDGDPKQLVFDLGSSPVFVTGN